MGNIIFGIDTSEGLFHPGWKAYLDQIGATTVPVNILRQDVLRSIKDCGVDIVLHSPPLNNVEPSALRQMAVARLEAHNVLVFPGSVELNTFDDKVAQYFFCEPTDIPFADTLVTGSPEEARAAPERLGYPLVAKLRAGAGSYNVQLLRDENQLRKYVDKMFGAGISPAAGYFADTRTRIRKHKNNRDWLGMIRRSPSTIKNLHAQKMLAPKERGYVLFQRYYGREKCDWRVMIIGDRVLSVRRNARPGDFRASGGGIGVFEPDATPKRYLQAGLQLREVTGMRTLACDVVAGDNGEPIIIEYHYGFRPSLANQCQGSWEESLDEFSPGPVTSEAMIIDMLVKELAGLRR